MAVTSLPETVFAEVLAKHHLRNTPTWDCACGRLFTSFALHRAHVSQELAECLVFVGVEHEKGGQLYRVGRCPDDSPVYRIRESETT